MLNPKMGTILLHLLPMINTEDLIKYTNRKKVRIVMEGILLNLEMLATPQKSSSFLL